MPDVIVVGSALVEITPDTPGQSLVEARRLVPLPSGSAANFAICLAHLGVSVGFITRVGDDELGEWLLRRLAEQGIERQLMEKVPGQYTPCSFCWADLSGAKTFYFYRFPGYSDPMATLSPDAVAADTLAAARFFDFTEATIRAPRLRSVIFALAERARAAGVQVCYAVNYRPASWKVSIPEVIDAQHRAMAKADIVLMNDQEAEVAVTCGERGALVAADDQYWIDAHHVEVCYDVGAGDAFHAGLLAGLLAGMSPLQAGHFASAAAALKISRPADAPPPSRSEVLAMV